MIICKKCGAELNDNSLFCSQCGIKLAEAGLTPPESNITPSSSANNHYCCKCGAILPEGCGSCLICGTNEGAAPPPAEPEPSPQVSAVQKSAVRRHPKRLMAVCVSICLLLGLSAASLWFSQSILHLSPNAAASARDAIIYLTDDGRLRYITPSMDMPQDIVQDYRANTKISGSKLAKSSPSGRYIAYLNEYLPVSGISSGKLLVRDFNKKNAPDSPESSDLLISEHVTSGFFFDEDGAVLVFLTADGKLYATDFAHHRLLDEGVSEILDHTGDQMLYAKKSGGTLSVYLNQDVNLNGQAIHIDDGIISLSDYTPLFDRFIYLRENADGSLDAASYDVKLNKRQPLAVGVDGIVAADARVNAVLYQTSTKNPLHYDNIIEDEFAREDEKITEPDLADYPLLEEFVDKYGIDADYEGSLEYEEIVDERARFDAAHKVYSDKRTRDRLRDEIRATIDSFASGHPLLYDLHLFRDGATTKLGGGSYRPFDSAELDVDKGFAIWQATYWKDLQKTPITEYQQTFANLPLLDYLNDCMSDNIYLQKFGSSPTSIHLGDGEFYSSGWQLTEKGDGIYFAMGDGGAFEHFDNSCKLYYAPIQGGSIGNILQIDEKVDSIGPMLSGNRLLYYKEKLKDSCDLYLASGGTIERIGDDISLLDEFFKVENDGKTLLYCEHFNISTQAGNMVMLATQSRQLATEVHRVFYRDDLLVYFLRGYKNGKAELYSFGSGGLVRVDENVIAVME